MYLQSELRLVELECARVHHAATYTLKHISMQGCNRHGPRQANINRTNMLHQVKEDGRCIFKESSDLLSLNAQEFIMQQPIPSSISACKVVTATGRAKPTSTEPTCCVR